MSSDRQDSKTGIFYVQDPAGIVVMQDGVEMFRYRSKEELVETHIKAMAALEREMNTLLESHYRDDGAD